MTELHMAQNLEESAYMGKIMDLIGEVQAVKKNIVKYMFKLQVKHLKSNNKR